MRSALSPVGMRAIARIAMPGKSSAIILTIRRPRSLSCSRQRSGSVGSVSTVAAAASNNSACSSSRSATYT